MHGYDGRESWVWSCSEVLFESGMESRRNLHPVHRGRLTGCERRSLASLKGFRVCLDVPNDLTLPAVGDTRDRMTERGAQHESSHTRHGGEPGAHRFGADCHVEFSGLDAVDLPSMCKRVSDLASRDTPWTPAGRLVVAETQHVVATAGAHRASQALDEGLPVFVVEDVEEAAVQHNVKLLIEGLQVQRVADDEPGGDAAVTRFRFRKADSSRRHVNSDGRASRLRSHQRVFASSTPDIENVTAEIAMRSEGGEGALGTTDVPRWRRGVSRLELNHQITPLLAHTACISQVSNSIRRRVQSDRRSGAGLRTCSRSAMGHSTRSVRAVEIRTAVWRCSMF
jgi:hypothetical protein